MNLLGERARDAMRVTALAAALLIAMSVHAAEAQFTPIPGVPGHEPRFRNQPGPNYPGFRDENRWSYFRILPVAISANGATVVGNHEVAEGWWASRVISRFPVVQFGYEARGTYKSKPFTWNGQNTTWLGESSDFPAPASGGHITFGDGYVPYSIGTFVTGVSADGQTIVGNLTWSNLQHLASSFGVLAPDGSRPFVWTPIGGYRRIQGLSDTSGESMRANAVSGNGVTVVGVARRLVGGSNYSVASPFTWTATSGMKWLATGTDPAGGLHSGVATAASYDGSIVVGSVSSHEGTRAVLWDRDGRPLYLGSLSGSTFGPISDFISSALDVSFDGRSVAGDAVSGKGRRAFYWTAPTGLVDLGTLPGYSESFTRAISGDGIVVVGYATSSQSENGGANLAGFRWTQATGMQSVRDWLAAGGVALPAYVHVTDVADASYNGNVIVGSYWRTDEPVISDNARNLYGFLARVGDAGNGFISDMGAFSSSVMESSGYTLDRAFTVPEMTMGSSRRMGGWHRMAEQSSDDGRGCGWARNERTRYRHSGLDLDTQELGGCLNVRTLRFGFGAGRVKANQPTSFGGDTRHDSRYVLLGAALPLGEKHVVSVTGMQGDLDGRVERRYQNGAAVDASVAIPEGEFTAAVARWDWNNAWRGRYLGVSPYATYSWSKAEVGAYRETGGGFPVAYGASRIDTREVAVGTMFNVALGPKARMDMGFETTRRWLDTGDGLPSRVIGLFDTSVPGIQVRRDARYGLLQASYAFAPSATLSLGARRTLGGEAKRTDVAVQYVHRF